jgi:hypothetical protein
MHQRREEPFFDSTRSTSVLLIPGPSSLVPSAPRGIASKERAFYHSPFRGGSCSGTGDRIGPSEHRQSESFAAVGLNRGWRVVCWRGFGGLQGLTCSQSSSR